MTSDLQDWKLLNGETEPGFPAGAVFGITAWRDLGKYVRLNGNVVQIAMHRSITVVVGLDPSLPPDEIKWYWLPSNLQRHIARLEQ
jgi:hypothetical protein